MALVEGEYCTDVRQDCLRWLDDQALPFARCATYSTTSRCVGRRVPLRFCMDRYEYVAPGERLPLNYASFELGSQICQGLGKRLCTDSEWNFACEGEEMRPYPYGYERKPVCNQDRTDLFENDPSRQVLRDLREPGDARSECMSPFGIMNMAGNMDEPTLREGFENNRPFRTALKGGWWMPARNRCRPATTAHDDFYKDIQVGVRCCGAAGGAPLSRSAPPPFPPPAASASQREAKATTGAKSSVRPTATAPALGKAGVPPPATPAAGSPASAASLSPAAAAPSSPAPAPSSPPAAAPSAPSSPLPSSSPVGAATPPLPSSPSAATPSAPPPVAAPPVPAPSSPSP